MLMFYCFGKDRGIRSFLSYELWRCWRIITTPLRPFRGGTFTLWGNEKAVKLSGVNTNGVLFFAYTNMGFLAAVVFDVISKKRKGAV